MKQQQKNAVLEVVKTGKASANKGQSEIEALKDAEKNAQKKQKISETSETEVFEIPKKIELWQKVEFLQQTVKVNGKNVKLFNLLTILPNQYFVMAHEPKIEEVKIYAPNTARECEKDRYIGGLTYKKFAPFHAPLVEIVYTRNKSGKRQFEVIAYVNNLFSNRTNIRELISQYWGEVQKSKASAKK